MNSDRTLILCIDRDDDIGVKGYIRSPVFGRQACLNAATTLGLADPEDSDVNAIFQAVRLYDERLNLGEDVVVAVLAGSGTNTIEGDRKIAQDLENIVTTNGITRCILVTDGAEDEYILPIIQSNVRVASVSRVIVKQMPNLEGTYYILKKFFDDPQVARTFLVPLGICMLLYAVAVLIGFPDIAIIIVVGVLGVYLLFKGYGIDEYFGIAINGLNASFRGGKVSFLAYITALFVGLVALLMGFASVLQWYPEDSGLIYILFGFFYGSIFWFAGAGLIAMSGKLIDAYNNEKETLSRLIVLPFFIAAGAFFVFGASVYVLSLSGNLDFPYYVDDGVRIIIYGIIGAILITGVGIYVQHLVHDWIEQYFKNAPRDYL